MKLYHDIETRSPVDLKNCGVYVYASHPLTEITMFSWAIDDAHIQTWYPFFNEPIPPDLEAALLNPEIILCAHNSSFERILETLSIGRNQKPFSPEIITAIKPISRWHCTAAKAASAGLPRTLEGAGRALGLSVQKDLVGHRLMLKLCKPRGNGPNGEFIWYEDPDDVRREGLYCEQDVAVERSVDLALPNLTPTELKIWQLTERTNDRGIAVDAQLLSCMANFVGDAERELNARLRIATCPLHQDGDPRACKNPEKCSMACGCVPKISNPMATRKWLVTQGYDDTEEIDENTGKARGLGKDVVSSMLESDSLPTLVREVLTMRHEGGKSSTSKYKAAISRINNDGRIRGTLVYCGAAGTKRFCLAEDTMILVKDPSGEIYEKPIQVVELDDLVWDGDEWVSHEGVVYSGDKEVIEHDGIIATAEHVVYYEDGFSTSLGEAAANNISLFKGNRDPYRRKSGA